MAEDNVTPMPLRKSPKELSSEDFREIVRCLGEEIQLFYCTLECASIALDKAENESDLDRWSRAGRVVQHCVSDLESIRDTADELQSMAARLEVAHGA